MQIAMYAVVTQLAAAQNIFDWAKTTMGTVYKDIVGIDTIAAVLFAVVCLIWKQLSSNPKSVEICNTWLKRIVFTWAVINLLGLIWQYVYPLLGSGSYQFQTSSVMIMPFLGL